MLSFEVLGKHPGIVSPPYVVYDFQEKCFSCYILLTDQISLSDCRYVLIYWAICALHFFISQVVTS